MRSFFAAIDFVFACGVVHPQNVAKVWRANNGYGSYHIPAPPPSADTYRVQFQKLQ
jgi:hypothetical protein